MLASPYRSFVNDGKGSLSINMTAKRAVRLRGVFVGDLVDGVQRIGEGSAYVGQLGLVRLLGVEPFEHPATHQRPMAVLRTARLPRGAQRAGQRASAPCRRDWPDCSHGHVAFAPAARLVALRRRWPHRPGFLGYCSWFPLVALPVGVVGFHCGRRHQRPAGGWSLGRRSHSTAGPLGRLCVTVHLATSPGP